MTRADEMVRDCCELSEADPEHANTLCINVHDLAGVVERYIEPLEAEVQRLRDALANADDLPPTRLGVCPRCGKQYWGDGSLPCSLCDPLG